jgi:hypothetical protein
MSNRDPKQCAKAVQGFWNNERELIKQGQGTRDWSVQEQIEIMNYKPSGGERKNAAAPSYGQGYATEHGMSYDKYEGHHMKSVAFHPEYQDDPNNIQALKRDNNNGNNEHLNAHGGKTIGESNGYYNPETGEITPFGDNPPERVQPQQLSEAYVDSAEYQYIQNSMNEQPSQTDANQQHQLSSPKDPTVQNEGIESFRTAVDEKESITSMTDASKSNNEGIASFRETSSGQSAESSISSEQLSGQSADSGGQSFDSGGQSM